MIIDEKATLKHRWGVLEGRKADLHTRNEKYAKWTLPYIYPREEQKTDELDTDLDSVGARAVNHLSNKLVETLFPTFRSFLKLEVSHLALQELKEAEVPLDVLDKALVQGEKNALRALDRMGHRTAATLGAKHLIITGNTLMYYPDSKRAQVYGTRDYCVSRDLSGEVLEMITRDIKAFETFTSDVQAKLKASGGEIKYEDGTNVTLYTQIKLEDDKFVVTQAADMIDLQIPVNSYAKKDLPWVPLVWNLSRGDDYGRGLVEDYRGAFNALDVLSTSLLEGIISAATVKFLVNPASVVDVAKMNSAPSGSYHVGRDGDIVAVKSDKHLDFQNVRVVIQDYTGQLSSAFLLNSTRNAERVTAEEIRDDARELETSFGGLYSRFTEDWQERVARLVLSRQDIMVSDQTIFPVIVTGLDTLSRLGDIDNYRFFVEDLSLIGSLPEYMQAYMKVPELMTWVGNNRGVDYTKFLKTNDEVAADQAQQAEQEQAALDAQTEADVAAGAGKELVKQ
jgi:hypothetical protein